MKKILSIILTLLMLVSVLCVAPVSAAETETAKLGAAPEILYLNAGVWDQAGATFKAWVWGGSDADKWIYFTDADGDGIYEAPLGGTYTGMKVLRQGPGQTDWDAWNDSGDQTIPTDGKNMLVVEDWSQFSWSTYVAPTPVQPGDASAYYLMGTLTDWATGQNMVYAEDTGVVTTTLELEAETYELKIKKDSNWMGVSALTTTITAGGTVGGTDNITLAADGGTYTFNFTIAAKALEIVYTAPEVPEPTEEPSEEPTDAPAEEPTDAPVETPDRYTVAGGFLYPQWTPDANDMTYGEYEFDGKTYDYTLTVVNLPAGTYEFKVTNGTWDVSYPATNYTFTTTGTSDVTIYFNSTTTEIAVFSAQLDNSEFVVDSMTVVGNGDLNWLNGANWDTKDTSNDMTEVAPGVYEITYSNVDAFDAYVAKFVVNHSWAYNWNIDGVFDGGDVSKTVEMDGSDVTLRIDINGFDFATKSGNVVTEWIVTPPENIEPTEEPTEAPATEAPATEAPATEAPEAETMTIYFSNNLRWTGTIYAYAWDADNGNAVLLGTWPGTAMNYADTNEYGEDIYSIEVPVEFDCIIFNNASSQTKDIPATALYDGVGVYVTDTEEGFGTYDYVETPDEPTDAPSTGDDPTDAPVEPEDPQTVYFVDYPDNFPKVYAYAWTNTDNGADIAVAWPGVEMELTGEALSENAEQAGGLVYSATFDKAYENIIFVGEYEPDYISQSADLTFEAGKYCYWGDECWYDSIADIEADWPYVEPSTGDEPTDKIYTVAGAVAPSHVDSGIFGTPWDTSNVDNDLVYDEETGLWSITYTDVAKTAETADYDDTWYEYKIVADHTWDESYNHEGFCDNINNHANAKFDVEEDGSTVTIYFNGECCWAEVGPSTDTPDEPEGEYITVYFQNNWLWSDVRCYFDGSAYCDRVEWPGAAMDYYDNDGAYDVYYMQVPADATVIVFNGIKDDGTGTRDQSLDITEGFYDGICYYMTWNDGNDTGSIDITVLFPNMGGGEGGSEVEPTGSSLEGLSATLGGKIGYNLHYKISSDIMADETARFVVYRNSEPWYEIPVTEYDYYDEERELYVFTVELAAKEMADSIASKVISDSYNTFFNVNSFSGYCSSILDDPVKYAREQDLVKALLNYGTASQVYFGYNTDIFANYWLSEADREVPVYDFSDYAPVIEGEADGIEFFGASLILESDTYLKFYFKVDESKLPEGVEPAISINGLPGAGLERNGNLWTITMPSVAAHQLSEEYVLSLGGQTVTYSALSYVYTAQQSGKTNLVALANALGAYSNAADLYKGE